MKNHLKIAGGLAALLLSMSTQASVINGAVIDLFADPADGQSLSDYTNDGIGEFSEEGSFTSILGGYRDLYVNAINGASPENQFDLVSKLKVFGGKLIFSNDTGVTGEAVVQWDGGDDSKDLNYTGLYTGLSGINFITQAGCPVTGCDHFDYSVGAVDQGFVFTVGIYTDANNWTEIDLVSDGSTGSKELSFDSFVNPLSCGLSNLALGVAEIRCGDMNSVVDMNNVGAMQLILNVASGTGRTVAVDLAIGTVRTHGIPEPGTIALLGMGLLIGGLARTRRTKKAKV